MPPGEPNYINPKRTELTLLGPLVFVSADLQSRRRVEEQRPVPALVAVKIKHPFNRTG